MFRVNSRLKFIQPQLPSPVSEPPVGAHWIHEVKHDGYRSLVVIENGEPRVYTRSGLDWTNRYRGIVRAASALPCSSAILDGEAIVQDSEGASDFAALQSAIGAGANSIIFYAFDLLHLNGEDLRKRELWERRAKLKELVGDDRNSRIQFSDEFTGSGAALFKACGELGLEGIVSKHAMAPYRSGRSKTWLKTKCFTESNFVVVGTDRDRKSGAPRVLLAHKDSGGLSYAGAAFIALDEKSRTRFFGELERLTTSWASFKSARQNGAKWYHHQLTVEVKHLAGSKHLRHATVRKLVD
jgi:bifunctional non-homologous end joining protein LigD